MRKSLICTLILSILCSFILLQGCGSNSDSTDLKSANVLNQSSNTTSIQAPVTENKPVNSWLESHKFSIYHTSNYAGFLNEKFGITCGFSGETHYTNDGGKTWPDGKNESACRFGLEILDEKIAWTCGNDGNVRTTTDGGKTWTALADFGNMEPDHSRFLSFIDSKTGWIATLKKLGQTTDGGKTWTELRLPDGVTEIAAISLRTANDGYLLDAKGVLFVTADGGKTWTRQDLGFEKLSLEKGKIYEMSTPHAVLRFTDSDNGLIAFSAKDQEGEKTWIMETSNGGKDWSRELLPLDKKFGYSSIYVSRDAKLLTLANRNNNVIIFKKI